jgi:acylphosphatase
MAQESGFNGYVKNLSSGDVEAAITIADDSLLNKFINILKKGSLLSSVKEIQTFTTDEIYSDSFDIRYD